MKPGEPKLTETLPIKHPLQCGACGSDGGKGDLQPWEEADDRDVFTGKHCILCPTCADMIIEKHPRLYRLQHENKPMPGTMACCAECDFRDGYNCKNPKLIVNGGPGLLIKASETQRAFMDGTDKAGRRVGWVWDSWNRAPMCSAVGKRDD